MTGWARYADKDRLPTALIALAVGPTVGPRRASAAGISPNSAT